MIQPVPRGTNIDPILFRWLEEVRHQLNYRFLDIKQITESYTALTTDKIIWADATAGALTVTLPTVATAYDSIAGSGMLLVIVKVDSSGNAVTVDGDGSETINGTATQSLSAQWDNIQLNANGTQWVLLG